MMADLESRRERVFNSFKEELREVALEVFARRGYDFVLTRDIAFAAGIPERSFSRYFPDKEDLLLDGYCENGAAFHAALMALPRSLAPIDAFQRAMSDEGQPPICLERILALVFHSVNSWKLRAAFNERGVTWQADIAGAIADWLGCSAEADFRPAFWASAIFTAMLSAARAEAAEAALNSEFIDPARVVYVAFENLRLLTAPASKASDNVSAAASKAPVHRLVGAKTTK